MGGARGRLVSRADRLEAISLIKESHANGARKHKACDTLGISTRTFARWDNENGATDKRKEAKHVVGNKLSPEEKALILSIVNSEKYRDLPPSKIVPMLADEGEYIASESSFYRILREEKQLSHRGKSKPAKHKRPDECIATAPNQVWCWDITFLPGPVRGEYYYLYMIIDVFSRKIVGWSVHDIQSGDYAADLAKQACIDEGIKRDQLTLHSDNGSPMKGITMLSMLQVLGVIPSFSRPSVSDDNPFAEALFRTVKYHAMFPSSGAFMSIAEARKWCIAFVCWYNRRHLHSGLKFITPEQRHTGQDKAIMEKRHQVYLSAKQRRPDRWSGNTRNWTLPTEVRLNPDKKKMALCQKFSQQQAA